MSVIGEEIEKALHYSCPAAKQLLNNDWELQYERSCSGGRGALVAGWRGVWGAEPRRFHREEKQKAPQRLQGKFLAIHMQET